MDYIAEARNLVQNLDQRMGPSPYDIAWMARLRAQDGEPHWPDLTDWLLENQRPDGSWGGEIEYYHDRIICTLIAVIALGENGRRPQAEKAIQRGERYLWHHTHLLPRDPFELVGFELIFPTLLGEARALNLGVPSHACGYEDIQTEKLRLIPPEMLYSPSITTVHSLEFLGQAGDPNLLSKAMFNNGSLGNSPATTAYYLLLDSNNQKALAYLEKVRDHMGHAIMLYPFRLFELIWVLNNLAFSGLPVTEFAGESVWEMLYAELGADGISLDPTFGIPDGDNTAVCSRLLVSAGYDIPPSILAQFEDQETHTFRTYNYERNASIGTNVHALEALNLLPDYPNCREVREQITLTLLNNRIFNTYWIDKWHTSPYYATAHALVGLLREGKCLAHACRHTVDWLLHTQRKDGSWGFFETGTAEETAYTLTALLHYNRYEEVDAEILHQGARYLECAYRDNSIHPALWIDKCLYMPYDIVQSAVLAALILYTETFGCPAATV